MKGVLLYSVMSHSDVHVREFHAKSTIIHHLLGLENINNPYGECDVMIGDCSLLLHPFLMSVEFNKRCRLEILQRRDDRVCVWTSVFRSVPFG